MDALFHDVRSAIRSLTRARAFTAAAVLVFALGIGLNTALFSIVNAVFFRPLPVEKPEELVYLYEFWHDGRTTGGILENVTRVFEVFGARRDIFASMTGHGSFSSDIRANEQTERRRGELVLANYFDVLGVTPVLGRALTPSDDLHGDEGRAVVISYRYWMTRFNGNPAAIGTTVRRCCRRLPGRASSGVDVEDVLTIVGVAPRGFKGVSDPWTPSDFWITYADAVGPLPIVTSPIARLAPGLPVRVAQEAMRVQGEYLLAERRKAATTPGAMESLAGRRFDALPANDVRTPFNPAAALVPAQLAVAMTIVVMVVLLIATANVTGLLMARGVARANEIAVRRVLGASLIRVARQLAAESALLATLGGALGLLLAWWMLALFRTYTPDRFSIETPIDVRGLLFTAATGLLAGIGAAAAPSLQAARINLVALLPGIPAGPPRRIRQRLRHLVVIPQVALSTVLLVAAGLQIRALLTLELADLGYETRDRVVLSIRVRPDPAEATYGARLAEKRAERGQQFYRQLHAQLSAIPAAAVALTDTLPPWVTPDTSYAAVRQEDFARGRSTGVSLKRSFVDSGYFRAMGIRLLEGREFDTRDLRPAPLVTVVNEALARRLSPDADVVGTTIALVNNFPGDNEKPEQFEIVGIVNDVDPILLDRQQAPVAYLALGQQWNPSPGLIVAHIPGTSQQAIADVSRAVTGADLFAEVSRVQTMDQVVADVLYPRRMAAAILAASAGIGLLLATVGLYGVISYSLAQRRHELGVRSALGASRGDIVGLVLRDGGKVIAAGTALGALLSYAATQLARGRVSEMPPLNWPTLAIVPVFLAAVVLTACYLPARRAARVDPLDSLRAL